MSRPHTRPRTGQRGATLIVALVFLTILSLLGATVAGNNVLQERMAGNTRNHDLAFQAAEACIQAAKADIGDAGFDPDAIPAFMPATPNTADEWRNWPTANVSTLAVTPGGVCAAPQYYIEKMPDDSTGNQYFRVTTLGVGGGSGTDIADCIENGSAIVILQAMFRIGVG
jgi:type IV pilus assembly protein PilX